MTRPILSADKMSPAIHEKMASFHSAVIDEVATAVAKGGIVIVGMAQNPFVKKARKQLETAGITYHYLEFGSYFSQWKERLAIKMWAGFPTFPMVFVDGVLIGGNAELTQYRTDGKLPR